MRAIGGRAISTGNVRIVHLDATMKADQATYDREAKTVTLVGNVRFESAAKEVTAEKLIYRLDTRAISTEGPSKVKLKDVGLPPRSSR